jgi:DNA-binding transcriptional LysR family regulator
MIELRLLRYFVAVAETEHVGLAARRLHVSQSPLSRQIRQLEDALGVQLFQRERQRIKLSDAGRWLLSRARDVLSRVDELEREAHRLAHGETGRIAIGFVSTALWTGVLPTALRELRREHPHLQVELRHASSTRQIAAVRAGELDVGLVQRGIGTADLQEDRVLVQPYVLAVPRSSPLARRTVRPAQLNGQPWIVVSSADGDRDRWAAAYGAAGFTPNVVVEVSDWTSALTLVDAELGLALVPEVYRKAVPTGVVMRSLPWLRIMARLSLIRRRDGTVPLVSEVARRILRQG